MTARYGMHAAGAVRVSADADPRAPRWQRFEALVERLEKGRVSDLTAAEVREMTRLYRAASSDLLEEIRRDPDGQSAEYLRSIVGRGHSVLDRGAGPDVLGAFVRFFVRDFPATVRARLRAILVCTAVFLGGAVFGGWRMASDPGTGEVLLPFGHRYMDASERVADEEKQDAAAAGMKTLVGGPMFAAHLFENNSRVTYLAFGLSVTGGVGTVLLDFANGAYLGAVAVKYVEAGKLLFLVAWIAPHGVLEIPAILLGSAAGLILARALFAPGIVGRRRAMETAGRDALTLLLGATATLLVAGAIEGTISQVHEPALPYVVKIAFAAVVGGAYVSYLALAGRDARA